MCNFVRKAFFYKLIYLTGSESINRNDYRVVVGVLMSKIENTEHSIDILIVLFIEQYFVTYRCTKEYFQKFAVTRFCSNLEGHRAPS